MEESRGFSQESGFRNFSPKRSTPTGTGSTYELYLPDYNILRP
jgi:hypothetical protein